MGIGYWLFVVALVTLICLPCFLVSSRYFDDKSLYADIAAIHLHRHRSNRFVGIDCPNPSDGAVASRALTRRASDGLDLRDAIQAGSQNL